eukprot:4228268-Pleurochrysis_carterae.AAC.1
MWAPCLQLWWGRVGDAATSCGRADGCCGASVDGNGRGDWKRARRAKPPSRPQQRAVLKAASPACRLAQSVSASGAMEANSALVSAMINFIATLVSVRLKRDRSYALAAPLVEGGEKGSRACSTAMSTSKPTHSGCGAKSERRANRQRAEHAPVIEKGPQGDCSRHARTRRLPRCHWATPPSCPLHGASLVAWEGSAPTWSRDGSWPDA